MTRKGSGHDYDGKASFDHVYDLKDPRGYFEALVGELSYREPEHGSRLFRALVDALGRRDGGETTVVDLCCSYGVGAALLKCDLTLDDLYARYASEDLAGLSSEELAAADAGFYAESLWDKPPEVVGIDTARNAVLYALRAGLLDRGVVADLEREEPTQELRRAVSGADLITATGCVGYVLERTFDSLLASMPEGPKPWVGALVARFVHYEPIAEVLSGHGLLTEKLPDRTFPRRRFKSRQEQEYVLSKLAEKGVDPTGKETEGWYHADFWLSRPADEASDPPLETLLAPADDR